MKLILDISDFPDNGFILNYVKRYDGKELYFIRLMNNEIEFIDGGGSYYEGSKVFYKHEECGAVYALSEYCEIFLNKKGEHHFLMNENEFHRFIADYV